MTSGMQFERGMDFGNNRVAFVNDLNGVTFDGESNSILFEFPVAVDTWTMNHGQGRVGLRVVAVDDVGDELVGDVTYVDDNTVRIQWAFPIAGVCRISL